MITSVSGRAIWSLYGTTRRLHMPQIGINQLLQNALQCEELDTHFPFVRSLLGQAIQLNATADSTSIVGGRPRVPTQFDWPEHVRGHHTAIAQIDCSQLPANSRLPATGLLTFFAAHDPDGDSWFSQQEFIRIYHFDDSSTLQLADSQFPQLAPRPVSFDLKYSLPFNRYLREDWPWSEDDHDAFEYGVSEELGDAVVNESGDFLLGHAPGSRIAGNPSPGDDWELLLLLRSDAAQKIIWGDDSALMIFIESDALTRMDFSNPKCTIG